MRIGFCTTMPSSCWALIASSRMALASNPTKRTLPARPMSCNARSIPIVEDSFTVKMPCRPLPKRLRRFSDARLAVSRVGPAYWSDDTTRIPGYFALSCSRKPRSRSVVLADPSAYRRSRTAPRLLRRTPRRSAAICPPL